MFLAVRVDAGNEIGLGHAMRMLALTQAARDAGHAVSILTVDLTTTMRQRFIDEGATVISIPAAIGSEEDAVCTVEAARGAEWLILDGYRFVAAYIAKLANRGAPCLLAIDDYGHAVGAASLDLLLNPNLHAKPDLHTGLPRSCRMLLGPTYALLRRDFRQRRFMAPVEGRAKHVLVSCGGSDPAGITAPIVRTLSELPGSWHATVVVGPADPRGASTVAAIKDDRIAVMVDVVDMAALMATCDAGVIAAGGTALELACVGVPMALAAVADNQRPVARAFVDAGAALDCGPLPLTEAVLKPALVRLLDDEVSRAALRQQAGLMVDGEGAGRVVGEMLLMTLSLRRATMDDAAVLFSWANDPETRRWSFSSATIAWDGHLAWLSKRCEDAQAALLIAENAAGAPVGTARLAPVDGDAEISLTVAPEVRGTGIGARLIGATCRWAWRHTGYGRIHARIRPDNQHSLRAFRRNGFRDAGPGSAPDGSVCITCTLERPSHA